MHCPHSQNVVGARFRTSHQSALVCGSGQPEQAILQAELKLSGAELAHAQRQFDKTIVRARIDGLVGLTGNQIGR